MLLSCLMNVYVNACRYIHTNTNRKRHRNTKIHRRRGPIHRYNCSIAVHSEVRISVYFYSQMWCWKIIVGDFGKRDRYVETVEFYYSYINESRSQTLVFLIILAVTCDFHIWLVQNFLSFFMISSEKFVPIKKYILSRRGGGCPNVTKCHIGGGRERFVTCDNSLIKQ